MTCLKDTPENRALAEAIAEAESAPWVKGVINSLSDTAGAKLTRTQAYDLVAKRPALRGEIEEWGANDTLVCEHLADALLQEVFGEPRSWPTYGDKVDMKAFHAELATAAKAKGYDVR